MIFRFPSTISSAPQPTSFRPSAFYIVSKHVHNGYLNKVNGNFVVLNLLNSKFWIFHHSERHGLATENFHEMDKVLSRFKSFLDVVYIFLTFPKVGVGPGAKSTLLRCMSNRLQKVFVTWTAIHSSLSTFCIADSLDCDIVAH